MVRREGMGLGGIGGGVGSLGIEMADETEGAEWDVADRVVTPPLGFLLSRYVKWFFRDIQSGPFSTV